MVFPGIFSSTDYLGFHETLESPWSPVASCFGLAQDELRWSSSSSSRSLFTCGLIDRCITFNWEPSTYTSVCALCSVHVKYIYLDSLGSFQLQEQKISQCTSSLLRCSAIIIAFLSSSLNIGSLTGGPEPVVDNLTTTYRESDKYTFHKYRVQQP